MDGAELIAAERRRQIDEEGWTREHDFKHFDGQLSRAAAVYALSPHWREKWIMDKPLRLWLWPWGYDWWKPSKHFVDGQVTKTGRVRELVKAGALIAADIDRLQAEIAEEDRD